jgi:hypothetical protein
LTGQNMSALREHLPRGVYILRNGKQTMRIVVN